MSENSLAISIENLSLEYRVYQYRSTTFKEFIMNRLKGKGAFQVIKALKNVSFTIQRGESVALLGHNGCGKSTLLKCIAGIYHPPGARIIVLGRTAPMIELGAGFDSELSGRENIRLSCMLMGLSQEEIDEKIDRIVEFSELKDFIDIPFKNYSSGMQARLGFACTTAVDPDVLLVDEVLSVGDTNFARKCLDRIQALRKKGTTVVLVSHDAAAVRTFCARGIVLDEGAVQFDGPIDQALSRHEQIMDRRYLESLPEDERKEIVRLRTLHSDSSEKGVAGRSDTPKIRVLFQTYQDGNPVQSVDVTRPLEFHFYLRVESPELFAEDASVGFALHNQSDVRIGGLNNLAQGVKLPLEKLRESREYDVVFKFEKGIECLATGRYKMLCGVHDRGITRTIFIGDVGSVSVRNPLGEVNLDRDIVMMSQFISAVEANFPLEVK